MPTIVSHPATALLRPWFGALPRPVVVLGLIGAIAPDFDVIAFLFRIPYASMFGHRGFTHSIVFALLFASLTFALRPAPRFASFAFVFACTLSHPILDAMTTGGLGVAFFSPFSNERYFFPWRPIAVSPIGARFFSARGVEVLLSELVWVWAPMAVAGAIGRLSALRKRA